MKPRPARRARPYAVLLANALRGSKWALPQVLLVGEQVTRGPGCVEVLRVADLRIEDRCVRAAMARLDVGDTQTVRGFLWAKKTERKDVLDLAPSLPAFERLWAHLLDVYGGNIPLWAS